MPSPLECDRQSSHHGPWAKLLRHSDGSISAVLPLIEHALDVAAVAAALFAGEAWERAWAIAAGRPLTKQDRARIVTLVALHDLGKANAGFQARLDPKAPPIGHEGQVAALVRDPKLALTPAGRALGAMIASWGAAPYLAALMAHHGRPRAEYQPTFTGTPPWSQHVTHWRVRNGYDPVAEAKRLVDQVREHFPLAWEPGEPLPDSPRAVSLFAGLVTLADWTGSDAKRFPVGAPYGPERVAMRALAAELAVTARGLGPLPTPDTDFRQTFDFPPRGVQIEAAADDLGTVALIEAETGSGKTEAALWRWLELRRRGEVDGLFFALPTRSAAVQLHTRVCTMLQRVWEGEGPEAVLAVPGYLRVADAEGQALPGWEVRWDDEGEGDDRDHRWAAERAERFLAARAAVGTIDQALLAALRVKHAPVRAATLARSLLVVDEVHASDAYMSALLGQLLDNHVGAGGHALLLSATLGGAVRAQLLKQPSPTLTQAMDAPYPALSGRTAPPRLSSTSGTPVKRVTVEVAPLIGEPKAIAAMAVAAARQGAAVLVVRNSVRGAVAVAQAAEALAPELIFRAEAVPTVHHGRFAPSDRRLLDDAVEHAFGRERRAGGIVLVGTQTLEQSLDIDADFLITDLAPMDVLLQRIGRLHRHERNDRGAYAATRATVLRPADRDLGQLLGRVAERHGLGPTRDHSGVYPNVLQLEATLRLLEEGTTLNLPRDNRQLVELALHPEQLSTIAGEKGTAWLNHAAQQSASAFADRSTAHGLSYDTSVSFRELSFPKDGNAIATRLGARDLIVDLEAPLPGPFGHEIARLTIPHWMAGQAASDDQLEQLPSSNHALRFRLRERHYTYDQWGLALVQ